MAGYASRASSGTYWAEKCGVKERDDSNGGMRSRTFEGRYSTSGLAPGGTTLVQKLPVYGDGYPGSSLVFYADVIERTMLAGNADSWEATVVYVPYTTGQWSTSNAPFSILPRSWSISGELLQFADTGDYYYVNLATDNTPIKGDVPAFKKIATGRYVIQEVVPGITAARTRAKRSINTKNNAAFDGVAIGDLLYLGFESDEFVNADGDVVWRLRHNFLERDIPDKVGDGWEYVLRDDTAAWTFIQISPAADEPLPIYPSSSFSEIFGTT